MVWGSNNQTNLCPILGVDSPNESYRKNDTIVRKRAEKVDSIGYPKKTNALAAYLNWIPRYTNTKSDSGTPMNLDWKIQEVKQKTFFSLALILDCPLVHLWKTSIELLKRYLGGWCPIFFLDQENGVLSHLESVPEWRPLGPVESIQSDSSWAETQGKGKAVNLNWIQNSRNFEK